jgi:uncharacterized protein (TIGR02117 family)
VSRVRIEPCSLAALLLCLLLGACAIRPDTAAIPLTDTPHTVWLNTEVAPAGYVRIGWGDGDYYTGRDTSVVSATRALVASRYSAIQVIGYTADPFARIPEETRVPLRISDEGLRRLVAYFDASFALTSEDNLKPLRAYIENTGVFFEASRRYGILNTCNTWSSDALRAAGLPVRSTFALTAQSVFEQARAISIYQSSGSR